MNATEPIRVLHTEWSDGWGGQEIRIVEEMCAVRERGVEVFLACREHAKIKAKAEERGIPVFPLPFRGNTDLKTLMDLVRIVRKHGIHIVNTHSGKDTWVGGLAAKIAGAKFIRTRHLSNPINPSRLNFINSLADFVITTGESVRFDMIRNNRISPEKIVSIPTGADENRFHPDCCDREEVRKELGILPGEMAIGILAVLRSFKRHDLFIEAAIEVARTHPDVLFLIAGEGPQRPTIERLIASSGISDRIRMLGHVDRPERFLKALDIFLLSSDSKEGVPQSVIQALMMGLPVIATDVGSTKDLFYENNFLLIPPRDVNLLVNNLKTLLDKPGLRMELSKRALENSGDFNKKNMATKIINVYKTLLNGK
jgi:glycosyltransferase involved in cell wall biosynthesis